MKNIILYITLITILYANASVFAQQSRRDVLSVRGGVHLSDDWLPHMNTMRTVGQYRIRDASPFGFLDLTVEIEPNVGNLEEAIEQPIFNYQNVLGLGHDVGGLALRGLMERNPKITGNILVGTPNRGSLFLRGINANGPDNLSRIEKFLVDVEEIIKDDECPQCGKRKKLLRFIESVKDQPYTEGAIYDPNSYYNFLPRPDMSTTAVIWGNAGEQTLGDFLSAETGILNPIDFRKCREEAVALTEAEIRNDELVASANAVKRGFLGLMKSLFTTLVTNIRDPLKLIIEVTKKVSEKSDDIIKSIDELKEVSDKRKKLLKCELVNQLIEAQWILNLLQGNSGIVTETLASPDYDPVLCEKYTYKCQYNTMDPNNVGFCVLRDKYCGQTITYFNPEPNDLVYAKSEQTLHNWPIDLEIEIEANHLEEQRYDKNRDAIDDLFSRSGTVFFVPRN